MFLEYSRCSVAGDDADRDPDRIGILIATTVLMLATLRFMWISLLMLVMKWRLTIVTLSIVLSVRLSVLRSVCL